MLFKVFPKEVTTASQSQKILRA